MDAAPLLFQIAALLERHRLKAVLIGNAAAALQGAPVTTIDIDFLFCKTPANLKKLKAIAKALDATLLRPYYPISGLFRIFRDADALQIDFMSAIDGVHSFEGLRKRAMPVQLGNAEIRVASLTDIIKSKKAAGRPQDTAVLGVLEKTLEETSRNQKSATRSPQKRE